MAKKNKSEVCSFRTMIGGQALIEGILMRGPKKQAVTVCTADGLVTTTEELHPLKEKYPAAGWPFVRGVVGFVESMAMGMKAITYSASMLPEDQQEEPGKFDKWIEEKFGWDKAQKIIIAIAIVLGVALAVGLFIILPTFIAGLVPGLKEHHTLRSVVEGVTKLVIFFVYLWACSNVKDVKRMFSYHGAEHKTIFCYEKGLPLTVDNVRPQSRFHPRCGTSFLFVVIILGVLLGFLINVSNVFARVGLRLLLLPVLVGVAYELNRWIGRHDNFFTSALSWPGRMLQHLTTNEPDDPMIEAAIASLEAVIPEEKGADAW